ncbi:MAG: polymerase sigma factor [Caulobacter sp.]|nr:polymerase sigma factor [Caulobacter sp.]
MAARDPQGGLGEDQGAHYADLVEAIAARRDRTAFAQLFDGYAPRVKGYLLRLGLSPAEAEEAAQDVLVAVWRKAETFDRRQASASTWIFRIARNRRIDLYRRQKGELDPDEPLLHPEPPVAADVGLETAQRETRVRQALSELPPEQLELVRRAFYDGLSHSEIAQATGLALGTVKSRLRLAFVKLKLRLENAE